MNKEQSSTFGVLCKDAEQDARCTACRNCMLDINGAYCIKFDEFVDAVYVCDEFESARKYGE